MGNPGEKGDPGKDGADGYTPIKGVDYFDGLPGKDGLNGKDGVDGKDGYTPVKGIDYFDGKDGVSATHSWNETVLTITSASGTSSSDLKGEKGDKGDSVKGDKGDTGATGVGVSSVKQTTTSSADGGSNVVTVTLSNGTTSTFTVKNGSKGSTGATGSKGADGKTPVRGTDYWTPADQEAIVQQVITALGTPVYGRVTADKKITLSTEHLTDDTYSVGYEDKNGNWVEIGKLGSSGEDDPVIINWLKLSTEIDGATPYNGGKGYKEDTRFSASSSTEKNAPGVYVTGLIPVNGGDIVRLKNISLNTNNADNYTKNLCHFNVLPTATDTGGTLTVGVHDGTGWGFVFDENGNLIQLTVKSGFKYIMLHGSYMGDDSIITINQELPE